MRTKHRLGGQELLGSVFSGDRALLGKRRAVPTQCCRCPSLGIGVLLVGERSSFGADGSGKGEPTATQWPVLKRLLRARTCHDVQFRAQVLVQVRARNAPLLSTTPGE